MTKTRTDWPRANDDRDMGRVFFSVFDDVTAIDDLDGVETAVIPAESMRAMVFGGGA